MLQIILLGEKDCATKVLRHLKLSAMKTFVMQILTSRALRDDKMATKLSSCNCWATKIFFAKAIAVIVQRSSVLNKGPYVAVYT